MMRVRADKLSAYRIQCGNFSLYSTSQCSTDVDKIETGNGGSRVERFRVEKSSGLWRRNDSPLPQTCAQGAEVKHLGCDVDTRCKRMPKGRDVEDYLDRDPTSSA
jgi:hypothetical protein